MDSLPSFPPAQDYLEWWCLNWLGVSSTNSLCILYIWDNLVFYVGLLLHLHCPCTTSKWEVYLDKSFDLSLYLYPLYPCRSPLPLPWVLLFPWLVGFTLLVGGIGCGDLFCWRCPNACGNILQCLLHGLHIISCYITNFLQISKISISINQTCCPFSFSLFVRL